MGVMVGSIQPHREGPCGCSRDGGHIARLREPVGEFALGIESTVSPPREARRPVPFAGRKGGCRLWPGGWGWCPRMGLGGGVHEEVGDVAELHGV